MMARLLLATAALSFSTRSLMRYIIFFFKQKTAYDIHRSLEFRRVLFRSLAVLMLLNTTMKSTGGPGLLEFEFAGTRQRERSEERRVGKECRSRRSPKEKRKKKGRGRATSSRCRSPSN